VEGEGGGERGKGRNGSGPDQAQEEIDSDICVYNIFTMRTFMNAKE